MWIVIIIVFLIYLTTDGLQSPEKRTKKASVRNGSKRRPKQKRRMPTKSSIELKSSSIAARNKSSALHKTPLAKLGRAEPSIPIKVESRTMDIKPPTKHWRAEPSEEDKVGPSFRPSPWSRFFKEREQEWDEPNPVYVKQTDIHPLAKPISRSPHPILSGANGEVSSRVRADRTPIYPHRIFVPNHPRTRFSLNTSSNPDSGKNQYLSRGEKFLIAEYHVDGTRHHFMSAKMPRGTPLLIESKIKDRVEKKLLRVGNISDLKRFLNYHRVGGLHADVYLTVLTEAEFAKEKSIQQTQRARKFASCAASYSSLGLGRSIISDLCSK